MNIKGTPPKDQGWEVKSRMTFRPTFVYVYKYLRVSIYKYLCSVKVLVVIVMCNEVNIYNKNDTDDASYYTESGEEVGHSYVLIVDTDDEVNKASDE